MVMEDYMRRALVRRMTSRRQVLEVMTEFWENHFHVPVDADGVFTHRVAYGDAIRARALGKFSDLLFTVDHPPGDGDLPRQRHLHRGAPQREPRSRAARAAHGRPRALHRGDVKDSARILTGWRVDVWKTFAASYSPEDHATGP